MVNQKTTMTSTRSPVNDSFEDSSKSRLSRLSNFSNLPVDAVEIIGSFLSNKALCAMTTLCKDVNRDLKTIMNKRFKFRNLPEDIHRHIVSVASKKELGRMCEINSMYRKYCLEEIKKRLSQGNKPYFFKLLTGMTVLVIYNCLDTIHDMKLRIYIDRGYKVSTQHLIIQGQEAVNDRLFTSYNPNQLGCIHLVLRASHLV